MVLYLGRLVTPVTIIGTLLDCNSLVIGQSVKCNWMNLRVVNCYWCLFDVVWLITRWLHFTRFIYRTHSNINLTISYNHITSIHHITINLITSITSTQHYNNHITSIHYIDTPHYITLHQSISSCSTVFKCLCQDCFHSHFIHFCARICCDHHQWLSRKLAAQVTQHNQPLERLISSTSLVGERRISSDHGCISLVLHTTGDNVLLSKRTTKTTSTAHHEDRINCTPRCPPRLQTPKSTSAANS